MKEISVYYCDVQREGLILREITSIFKNIDDYYMTRSWKDGEHLKIILSDEADREGIENIGREISQILDKLSVQYSISIKYDISINEMNMFKVLNHQLKRFKPNRKLHPFYIEAVAHMMNDLRFELQPVMTDIYYYLLLNNIKKEEAFPVVFSEFLYGREKPQEMSIDEVVNCFFDERISHGNVTFELMFQANYDAIKRFKREHFAFVKMWNGVWAELSREIEITLNELTTLYKIDVDQFIEYDYIRTHEVLFILLNMSLPFLHVGSLEKQQYMYMGLRYEEEVEKEGRHYVLT